MSSESPIDPTTLTVVELVDGLRAGARGSYPREAAVELLIRHWNWLARPAFLRDCVDSEDLSALAVRWRRLVQLAQSEDVEPAERAIALIAAHLGGFPDPVKATIDMGEVPPLAWLLASMRRREVDLVLGAISHAGGTHDHVDHVGEPVPGDTAGEWRVTGTSPRLRLGPLHGWPEPAMPGLSDDPSAGTL